jgi:hypothetical protein
MSNVLLDLNYDDFQNELLALQKTEQTAFLSACKKIKKLTWDGVYKDKGLHWEEITSKTTKNGGKLYSIRFSKKYRAVVNRDGDFMVFYSIHVDHDSAYG